MIYIGIVIGIVVCIIAILLWNSEFGRGIRWGLGWL